MKVAVMVGSLRKNSFNRFVFNNYRALADEGVEFIEIPIKDFPLYNADIQEQGFPKEVLDAASIIRGADGILFFSPEYNYSIPGALKNALDWISRLDQMPLAHKKASVIGASPGQIGTARMQYDLRKAGVFLNMNFMNRPEVMIGVCHKKFDDQGELIDKDTVEFLDKHLKAFKVFVSS